LAWGAWGAALGAGLGAAAALAAGSVAGLVMAGFCQGPWRRAITAAGFPLSAWAQGAGGASGWPAWAWLLLLLPLLVAYPLRAWRDAPFFPTPEGALQGLTRWIPAPASVLDAGCGLGHGLRACRRLWPDARLSGIEWSPLLTMLARVLCPWARVRRGDMWQMPWSEHDVVYVFQRPESMARVWAKACADMAPGSWLVSLEFEVAGQLPQACLQGPGRRSVWVYRVPAAQLGSIGGLRGR
jgi:SAM-dependent methyltransferase